MNDMPSKEFALSYSTNANGNSQWQKFSPSPDFEIYEFDYIVPALPKNSEPNNDYLGIHADTSGSGLGIDVRRVEIKRKG